MAGAAAATGLATIGIAAWPLERSAAVPPPRGSSAGRVSASYGFDVPNVKSQAEIGVGDVCELCRQTVRPASGGAAAEAGASPGWTCACPGADGPMVLQLEDG